MCELVVVEGESVDVVAEGLAVAGDEEVVCFGLRVYFVCLFYFWFCVIIYI